MPGLRSERPGARHAQRSARALHRAGSARGRRGLGARSAGELPAIDAATDTPLGIGPTMRRRIAHRKPRTVHRTARSTPRAAIRQPSFAGRQPPAASRGSIVGSRRLRACPGFAPPNAASARFGTASARLRRDSANEPRQ
ncbi:hypothetical protein WS86_19825 [Burkholderia savannae]|nr:hypothetical protein WS86_19825 [Burkholderia savannae]